MRYLQGKHKVWSIVMLLVVALASLGATRPASARPTVDGRFNEYWHEQGGLPIFGWPISEEAIETNSDTGRRYPTQWFERNRFELHAENARPYDVLLGRLGADRLRQMGRDWQRFPKAAPGSANYFAETGHAIAHAPFWRYWSSQGLEFDGRPGKSREESLALFGLPLSEPAMETNSSGDRVLTQWFERARFEDHGANGVLLGLLGVEVRQVRDVPVGRLKYLWPRDVPPELSVEPEGSFANDQMWMLHLAQPHARQPDVTIDGGIRRESAGRKLQDVTVRGQRGAAYVDGAYTSVLWSEDGQPYAVSGKRSLAEILRIATGLEAISRDAWQQRLGDDPAPGALKYFWPRTSPLTVWHGGGSYASETSFALHLAWPHSTEPDATISGGSIAPPPDNGGERVRVRGQQGTVHTLGSRRVLVWIEDGQHYMIVGKLRANELVALGNDLEALDLRTFNARLQAPQPRLKYFWPGPDQYELSVLPEPHGGSWATRDGFRLNLFRVHVRQPSVTLRGGTAVEASAGGGRTVTVRGQQASAYQEGAGYTLAWTEDGVRYMITSDLSLPDLLDLAGTLEVVDLATFNERIRPE